MSILFVAGSIAIKSLHPAVVERLQNAVAQGMTFVVGDADGVDTSIQKVLADIPGAEVTVYCSGDRPRNNVGLWTVETVHPMANPGSRAFFTAKDVAMAVRADYGLMVWDSRSTGTLTNVIELLSRGRTTIVFVNRDKNFQTVKDVEGLKRLVGSMSDTARDKAEMKIGLSRRIAALEPEQLALAV